jgi:hypothetical protein
MSARLLTLTFIAGAIALGHPAFAAPAPAAPPSDQDSTAAAGIVLGQLDPRTLEITSADGKWYVDLGALNLGPVRLPLLGEPGASAILVSAKQEGEKLILTLAAEKGELETSPIGRYELQPAKGEPIAVPELETMKTGAWTVKLVHLDMDAAFPNCCSCTPEYGPARIGTRPYRRPIKPLVQCCPNVGRCLGCGTCGSCCG